MDVGKRALRAAHAEDRTPMQVRSALIDAWVAALVDRRTFTPMSTAQARDLVTTLADRLIGAVRAPRSDVATAAAASVGATMADARITDPMALERVLVAIGQHLPDIEATGETHETPRPVAISSAFAAGFLRATGQRVLTEQEEMRTAEAVAMRRLREQLRTSQARFRSVFIDSAIGIGIADMDGGIVEVNPAFTAMLGHTAEDFQRIRVEDFFTNGDTEGHQAVYSELVDGARDHLRMEAPFPHADGHTVWTNLTVTVLRDADGTPRYTLAMAEDVSEQRSLREHLRHQALHDPLTGLANRVLFQQRLAAACAAGTRVGVCSIDLDDFKPINDTFGHDVGDAVLRHVARRLEACADGEPATIARMGGDEFVVLVAPSRGQGHVRRLAAKMVTSLERPYAIGALDVRLSASVGIVERAVAGTTPAELMKAADVTLYSAKRRGRGRPEVFEAGRAKDETDRLMLAATLPSALANDEFMLEYQPLVTLKDGAICGVEPLVRWSHPALGRVEPERFVAIAETPGRSSSSADGSWPSPAGKRSIGDPRVLGPTCSSASTSRHDRSANPDSSTRSRLCSPRPGCPRRRCSSN